MLRSPEWVEQPVASTCAPSQNETNHPPKAHHCRTLHHAPDRPVGRSYLWHYDNRPLESLSMENPSKGSPRCTFQIERQQPCQNLLVAQIVGPAVGVQHGFVELAMGYVQPGGTLTELSANTKPLSCLTGKAALWHNLSSLAFLGKTGRGRNEGPVLSAACPEPRRRVEGPAAPGTRLIFFVSPPRAPLL
jgi:hypothetical protein